MNREPTIRPATERPMPLRATAAAGPATHSRRYVTRAVDLREPGRPGYVLGASSPERQRLLTQCELFKPEARTMLERIGVGRNWWTIDVGCGPLGILDLLAEFTGPGAEVIGLERDPDMLEFGHELMAERGLDSVRLIQGDARKTGMPESSFDLAHARLLLVNVPEPEDVVNELANITRPGGWVALEEVDWISWTCDPMHPSWARLLDINATIWRKRRMNVNIGRCLPRMLTDAGLTDIQYKSQANVFRHTDVHQFLLLAFTAINRTEMIEGGYTTEEEYIELTESLRTHLENPTTYVTWPMFCQAWGRKPRA